MEALLKEALRGATSNPEVQTEVFNLSGLQITGCQHCNWCIQKQTPEKFCAISDGMDKIYPAVERADVIILATPVHIGRMSGLMKGRSASGTATTLMPACAPFPSRSSR